MSVTQEEITLCYNILLGRAPESTDILKTFAHIENLEKLRTEFIRSREFAKLYSEIAGQSKAISDNALIPLPLDIPPLDIEVDTSEVKLEAILEHIRVCWERLGTERAHHSVVTKREFLPAHFRENEAEFWNSGANEAERLIRRLEKFGFRGLSEKLCTEYGCGVGRVTPHLVKVFAKVCAYDISLPHLSIARERCRRETYADIDFVHVKEIQQIKLPPCDFFYSRIVLQHNPPPVIKLIIRSALKSLRKDGVAIFQVPVHALGYSFRVDSYLSSEKNIDMEMHCLPQEHIFKTINECGCLVLEVREDNDTGRRDLYISNTFVVRKK